MSFLIREISNLSPFKIKILRELSKRPITRNLLMSIYNLKRTTAFDILSDLKSRNLLVSSKLATKVRGKPASVYRLSELGFIFIKLFKTEKLKEPIKKKVPKKPTKIVAKVVLKSIEQQFQELRKLNSKLQIQYDKAKTIKDKTKRTEKKLTIYAKIKENDRKIRKLAILRKQELGTLTNIDYMLAKKLGLDLKKPIKKKIVPKKPTVKKKPTKTQIEKDKIARKIIGYSIRELKAYCKDYKIKGYSKLRKNQLRTLIVESVK